jgi:hypothetical protein
MGWVVNARPRPLYPRKGPGTHCIVGWLGPTGMENIAPHRGSIPGPSNLPVWTRILFSMRDAVNWIVYMCGPVRLLSSENKPHTQMYWSGVPASRTIHGATWRQMTTCCIGVTACTVLDVSCNGNSDTSIMVVQKINVANVRSTV